MSRIHIADARAAAVQPLSDGADRLLATTGAQSAQARPCTTPTASYKAYLEVSVAARGGVAAQRRSIVVTSPDIIFGRAGSSVAQIQLDHGNVSMAHVSLYVSPTDGVVFAQDLGSTNGTYLVIPPATSGTASAPPGTASASHGGTACDKVLMGRDRLYYVRPGWSVELGSSSDATILLRGVSAARQNVSSVDDDERPAQIRRSDAWSTIVVQCGGEMHRSVRGGGNRPPAVWAPSPLPPAHPSHPCRSTVDQTPSRPARRRHPQRRSTRRP